MSKTLLDQVKIAEPVVTGAHHWSRRYYSSTIRATQPGIKLLAAIFKDNAAVSGSAILSPGRAAVILDIPALFRDFRLQGAQAN